MTKKFIYLLVLIILLLFLQTNKKIEKFSNNTFSKPLNWKELKFTDKLKIYGKNLPKEYSLYADKYKVKDYINNLNIKGLNVPKTLQTLDINNNILDLNSLPKNCVIKTNNGSGDVIIIKDNKIQKMLGRGGKYKGLVNEYKNWKNKSIKPHITKTENHYKYIKPVILVEEYLGNNIKDYKFFCLNGKILFLQIDSNRFIKHCQNFYDENFNLLPYWFKSRNCNFKIKKPNNFELMKNIVKNISKIFEFCRVDLYEIDGKIYFGELTFVPEAGRRNFNPIEYDYEIGSLWE